MDNTFSTRKTSLLQQHPNFAFLMEEETHAVERYLRQQGFFGQNEKLQKLSHISKGNMNYTLLAQSNQRSFILKQARPWVEKYPQIDAPWHRDRIESAYHQAIAPESRLAPFTPQLYFHDQSNHILCCQYLEDCFDGMQMYAGEDISVGDAQQLSQYLSALHRLSPHDFPDNTDMRQLNYQHIFEIPLQKENGICLDSITPGLAAAVHPLKSHSSFIKKVQELGRGTYLHTSKTLLHGDFFPGSWLRTQQGQMAVIDYEFAFLGNPAIDIGICLAHFFLSKQCVTVESAFIDEYQNDADYPLAQAICGVEIMRRLIGVAQLPAQLSLKEKATLLELAEQLVCENV